MSFADRPKTGDKFHRTRASEPANARPVIAFPRAFTLIELLVVISMIALLMAILLPTLGRVRRHAQTLGCRANLRQWGIRGAAYAADNEGRLASGDPDVHAEDRPAEWWRGDPWFHAWCSGVPGRPDRYSALGIEKLVCCPVATKTVPHTEVGAPLGGSFVAWGDSEHYGSYGCNWCVGTPARDQSRKEIWWRTTNDPQAAGAPLMFDSCWSVAGLGVEESPPPGRDAVPFRTMETEDRFVDWTCFNRHDGGLNYLFLDWSVHKVGLKEIWALKWHRQFNTCGPWTKAGGATPEQWPAWMRKFKDY